MGLFIVKAVKGPATPAEISRWLFREPHTVSGLLERMEKQGLVRKVKNLERKNMIGVVIMEKGEETYQQSPPDICPSPIHFLCTAWA